MLERAEGGILFIKELGDVSPAGQRLLLGILEQGSYRPTGQGADKPLNVRILCSAFPGFERSESVRRELLSHLSIVVIRVPPLREYSEDVPELLRYHVDVRVDAEGLPFRRFSVAAQNRLRNYPWPGNVRELKNMVKRLLILGGAEEISLAEVEAQLATDAPEDEPLVKQDLLAMPLREAREHFERAYCSSSCCCAAARSGSSRSGWGWSARTFIASCARSGSISGNRSLTSSSLGLARSVGRVAHGARAAVIPPATAQSA